MIFLVESLPCDMDVAGIKHTRFGLLYTLLHQNEMVPFWRNIIKVQYQNAEHGRFLIADTIYKGSFFFFTITNIFYQQSFVDLIFQVIFSFKTKKPTVSCRLLLVGLEPTTSGL